MSDSQESATDTKNMLVEYWHSHIDIVSNISVFGKKNITDLWRPPREVLIIWVMCVSDHFTLDQLAWF